MKSVFIVVYWTLIYSVPGPCPDYKPDKFGRWPSAHCLVIHLKEVREEKERWFDSREEAAAFIKEAKEQKDVCCVSSAESDVIESSTFSVRGIRVKP